MAYKLATREELTRTPGTFADTVAGALNTHALFRVRNLAVPEGQSAADMALALKILKDTDAVLRPTLRMILHSAEQAGLEDVTALTDEQVLTMLETVWPFLVQVEG